MAAAQERACVLSLSCGKDSLACLGAIEQLGWPLDRVVHAEVWATDTIPANLPPMMEFKAKADAIIKERWGIEVEHVRAACYPVSPAWEVPGTEYFTEPFRVAKRCMGVEPVLINSALVSAQNRQRLYWVGRRSLDGTYSQVAVEQPKDCWILLRDILESGVCWKGKAYTLHGYFDENVELCGAINEEVEAYALDQQSNVATTDNGVSQTAEARKGTVLRATLPIRSRVPLWPYRTFQEVEQPESEFLLRLNEGGNVGLFEADGGMWKLKAQQTIKSFLERELAEEIAAGYVVVAL